MHDDDTSDSREPDGAVADATGVMSAARMGLVLRASLDGDDDVVVDVSITMGDETMVAGLGDVTGSVLVMKVDAALRVSDTTMTGVVAR